MFIDEVKVKFIAWKWWDWVVSWRREKCIPNGWPRWWNGWKWWDVILRANPNENTLWEFRHKKVIKAAIWIAGWTQELAWAGWEDLVINVPVGTLIKDTEWKLIYDLNNPWESYVLCKWWRWWYGNAHFPTSTRQAPAFAELGDIWETKEVILELKLVADIWIIGLPNAGKSTLIKSITNVKPKIADYPFTTIIPNLGVLEHKGKSLVLEDVPGLIEWASKWKWLGHNFLKHIERTTVLLHLIDLNWLDEIITNYKTIRNELENYNKKLAKKEEIIVLSKADLFDKEMIDFILKELKKEIKTKNPIFVISAPAFIWTEELKDYLINKYAIEKEIIEEEEDKKGTKIYDLKDNKFANSYEIKDLWDMKFEVTWERVEQIARMTNMSNYEAEMRLYDVLDKMWVLKKIENILNKKYSHEREANFFVWTEDTEIIPKLYISWKCLPLDKIFFGWMWGKK